jgi:hypothetical protein
VLGHARAALSPSLIQAKPAAAGKRQRPAGFSDHNAAWLKPAKKQQQQLSESDDEDDEDAMLHSDDEQQQMGSSDDDEQQMSGSMEEDETDDDDDDDTPAAPGSKKQKKQQAAVAGKGELGQLAGPQWLAYTCSTLCEDMHEADSAVGKVT